METEFILFRYKIEIILLTRKFIYMSAQWRTGLGHILVSLLPLDVNVPTVHICRIKK